MIFCGTEVKQGEKKTVEIPVPGAKPLRAIVFCGANHGRKLVLTAGVHGCEYVGILALRRLEEELNPAELSGTVVLLPLINSSGFYAGVKQIVPEDGRNLNRAFPGNESGTLSSRLAFVLEQVLYPAADFLADFHGGDHNQELTPLVFFPTAGEEAVNCAALEAAKSLTVSYRVRSTANNGLYSWAVQRGIPAVLIERGGAGRWSEQEVSDCCADARALLRHFGILPGENEFRQQTEIAEAVYEEAVSNGFWYPLTNAGARVLKDELLGYMETEDRKKIQEVRARFDGIVLYDTFALGVKAGDLLIAYGRPLNES